ncbi:MAG: AAA family ATPase, partial [Planctomycetota bacterium]
GRIFGGMCQTNHYVVTPEAQVRLLLGFQWLYENRDEHFGNGRLVRNAFENAIRRLANRIAGIAPLTKEVLTTLHAEDIVLDGVPLDYWKHRDEDSVQFSIACQGCHETTQVPAKYLGRKVRCKRCSTRFVAEWGEPAST